MSPGAEFEQGDGGRPVQVAYARDPFEARLIKGLLESAGIDSIVRRVGVAGPEVGTGANLGGHGSRIIVRADRADEAKGVLAETLSDPESFPEPVNAKYLAEASGRGPRNYSRSGGMARIYLWSFVAFAVVFAIFMLLRSV